MRSIEITMAAHRFGWGNFLQRWLFALLLVAATYNPSGFAYLQWAFADIGLFSAIKAVAGLALIIGWTIYLRATWRSLGPIGIALVAALIGSLIWLLFDLGLVKKHSTHTLIWLGIVATSTAMAIGLSWSHVRRNLSGQADMDDVDA